MYRNRWKQSRNSAHHSAIVDRAENPSFHEMGRYKLERYRAAYKLASTQEPSGDVVNQEIRSFRGAGDHGF